MKNRLLAWFIFWKLDSVIDLNPDEILKYLEEFQSMPLHAVYEMLAKEYKECQQFKDDFPKGRSWNVGDVGVVLPSQEQIEKEMQKMREEKLAKKARSQGSAVSKIPGITVCRGKPIGYTRKSTDSY